CHSARLALAVWKAQPARFAEYDRFLHDSELPPSISSARAAAERVVGMSKLGSALSDRSLDVIIARGVEMYRIVQTGPLPMLALPSAVLWGRVPAVKDLE